MTLCGLPLRTPMGATPARVTAMRQVIRSEGFHDGWSVMNRRERVQIQRSWVGSDNTRHKKGISTQIRWQEGCTSAVLAALTQVKAGLDRGLQLDEAAALLLTEEATASTHQRTGINWEAAVEKWRADKLSQGMKASTFDRLDRRRMEYVLQRVAHQRPENGKAFARLAPFNPQGEEYPPRSPSRSQYVNTVCQFLEFCVEELGFDEKWMPPASRRKLRGGKVAQSQRRDEDRQPNSGKAIPFPEEAIPSLMADFPDTRIGRQWRMAVGFLICFGIRGVELKYLRWEDGQLWSDYVKVNQAGETEPRILIGIDPVGMPGLSEQLIAEWTSGMTKMPPMRTGDTNTSIAILTYLNRRPFWSALREDTMAKGRRLSIYSFRHRYAKTLDGQKFPTRSSAMLMGHTRATFEKSYGNSELSPQELINQAATLL